MSQQENPIDHSVEPQRSILPIGPTPFPKELTPGQNLLSKESLAGGSEPLPELLNERRRAYFKHVIDGDFAPFIVFTGGSGAGKNYVINLLEQMGAGQSERLITRPRRESDPESDVVWDPQNPDHKLENILLSYAKHGHHYGFLMDSIRDSILSDKPTTLIAGDAGKVGPFNRALDSALPIVPVVNVRLDVPVDVMQYRLERKRQQGFKGEAAQRVEANRALESWEAGQFKTLKHAFNVHTIVNLSREEHRDLGYSDSQLKPLEFGLVKELFEGFFEEAKVRSRELARDIIEPIRLYSANENISEDLIEVLDEKLSVAAEKSVQNVILKGGLASAIYFNKSWEAAQFDAEKSSRDWRFEQAVAPEREPRRPVSPDIDWTMRNTPEEISAHRKLISDITGSDSDFADVMNKPVFHSLKLSSETESSDGVPIELDAIAVSRVQPGDKGFTYEFTVDDYLHFRRRTVELPSGRSVDLIPPEVLVAEKLTAGRGEELNKLDLYDAIGLAITQPLDVKVLQHVVEQQKYDPEQDTYVQKLISKPRIGDTARRLRDLGIEDAGLITEVTARVFEQYILDNASERNSELVGGHPTLPLKWSADAIKQIAFIDRMLSSLNQLEKQEEVSRFAGKTTRLSEQFGERNVGMVISDLKDFLHHLAQFQIGRPDVFVNESFKLGRLDKFDA